MAAIDGKSDTTIAVWSAGRKKLMLGAPRYTGTVPRSSVENRRYEKTFTKLRIWQLTTFKRIVYIDTDVVITNNIDDIFDIPGEWVVPMDAENGRYSSGMMVLRPSLQLFDDMMNALGTTSVSMELPDLNFLREFFDSMRHVHAIGHIPRWYQVYQEEFRRGYQSYLTGKKQQLTIRDQRIHGIHYPGEDKPWNWLAEKWDRFEVHFCDWRSTTAMDHEPHFVWFLKYAQMREELRRMTATQFFDADCGTAMDLTLYVDKLKRAEQEQRRLREERERALRRQQRLQEDREGTSNLWTPTVCEHNVTRGTVDLSTLDPVVVAVGDDVAIITWCTLSTIHPEGFEPCSKPAALQIYSRTEHCVYDDRDNSASIGFLSQWSPSKPVFVASNDRITGELFCNESLPQDKVEQVSIRTDNTSTHVVLQSKCACPNGCHRHKPDPHLEHAMFNKTFAFRCSQITNETTCRTHELCEFVSTNRSCRGNTQDKWLRAYQAHQKVSIACPVVRRIYSPLNFEECVRRADDAGHGYRNPWEADNESRVSSSIANVVEFDDGETCVLRQCPDQAVLAGVLPLETDRRMPVGHNVFIKNLFHITNSST